MSPAREGRELTDEVTFLKAIADDPHDDALRLRYGD